jgi:hypothetical protein
VLCVALCLTCTNDWPHSIRRTLQVMNLFFLLISVPCCDFHFRSEKITKRASDITGKFKKNVTFFTVEVSYKKLNSVALVRERTIPTERPPPVGEGSANFCG